MEFYTIDYQGIISEYFIEKVLDKGVTNYVHFLISILCGNSSGNCLPII